ncbi:MAG TPA: hypothetical protein VN642_03010 [Dongiaceae bacterium]|nr:hypothetical protein [Dongiaceae bacterium]
MDTYIIRVYRHNPKEPRTLVGLVEEAGSEGNRRFNSLEELLEILNPTETGNSKHPQPSVTGNE